jgi:hypothetical protein
MDVIYRLETATAADVHAALTDAPTYTTVRGLLRILIEKGHLVHKQEGRRYVYVRTGNVSAGGRHLAPDACRPNVFRRLGGRRHGDAAGLRRWAAER